RATRSSGFRLTIARPFPKCRRRWSQRLWPLKTGACFPWGLLVGAIFLHPIFGLLGGGAAGLIAGALGDCGIDEEFISAVNYILKPGKAALLLRYEYPMPKEMREEIIAT